MEYANYWVTEDYLVDGNQRYGTIHKMFHAFFAREERIVVVHADTRRPDGL